MFCLNGRMKKDRPAKQTFRIGNQICLIDYAFVNTWSFGDVQDFEVERIEGSDHWPLRLTIRSADKNQREKVLIALVEYTDPTCDIIVTGDFNANLIYTPDEDETLLAANVVWNVSPFKRIDYKGQSHIMARILDQY
ncbi:hypothetical protein NDU88_003154 [Pleurodeles waltl]|uniref:Endonuclease/exonuclease/phosphatase domain-containing protein n=1 Tax=Pleurodeles waltl TaxID=8319 RepID=A0AAV7WRZ4_PLEWA|nr:hypothetical protein NDU88_003154 [Pleurodeles waltl]